MGGSQKGESLSTFHKRLSLYVIGRGPETAGFFTEVSAGMKVGIDWRDLEVVKVRKTSSISE